VAKSYGQPYPSDFVTVFRWVSAPKYCTARGS